MCTPSFDLLPASDTGSSATDNITNDTTPSFTSGTGFFTPGDSADIYIDNTLVSSTTVDADGSVTYTASALADGTYDFDYEVNGGGRSTPISVTVDTTPPNAPALSLNPASDSGASGDGRTNDATPTVTGTVEAGSTVEIFDGSNSLGQATVSGTTFTFTSSTLGDGAHSLTAVATDVAGNAGLASTAVAFVVDTTAPADPTLALDPASDTGIASDRRTSDTTPTLTGTVETGSTVEIFQDGNSVGAATVSGTTFTFTSAALANGSSTVFTAIATDAAGNMSNSSTALNVFVDTTAPSVAVAIVDATLTNSDTSSAVTFTFSEAPTGFTSADITAVGGTLTGLAVDAGNPLVYNATFTASPNFSGTGSLTVAASSYADAAGNAGSTGSDTVTISTIASGGGGTAPISPLPTNGPDNLVGTTAADTISGGVGADTINGGLGADALNGNQGDDTVLGGEGNDTAQGGQGDDDVRGEAGNDLVLGDLGNDTVSGGEGNDTVYGGQGATATGVVDGNDVINGNQGNDLVNGNAGDDTVSGGQGDDSVFGGQGNDVVFGDLGNDRLSGDLGNDVLTGGAGSDVFVFAPGSGNDIITDFDFAEGDRLDLGGQTYNLTTASDGSAALILQDGDVIILQGVTQAEFSAAYVA